jgi:argininosuccinate synthase
MKIVLAYSGGLDTTVIVPWLKENYDGAEVIGVCVDVGQKGEFDGLEERSKKIGLSKLYIEDVKEELLADFVFPTVKSGAVYEDKYLLGTSIARPLIAKKLVDIAKAEGADAICHGATGKGNDQIRFELTIKALAPNLKIIAPWREWDIKSREEEIEYLQKRGLPVPMAKEQSYSRDANIWHISHEGLELEDPANEPEYKNILKYCVRPEDAPDTPTYIELEFKEGVLTAIDGKKLSPVEALETLNTIGGKNGIGICDLVENRVVGMKSRGVYETPGGTILTFAHRELEYLALDRPVTEFKEIVRSVYANLVYEGKWYTPLREGLDAFINATQKNVTGKVKLKLYKGNIISAGSTCAKSLYIEELASFATGDLYDHRDAAGFIELFGLSMKVRALIEDSK